MLKPASIRLCIFSLTTLLVQIMQATAASGQADFQRDVRPVLSKHCTVCHGPDEAARQADLRLDIREGAIADLGGYAAVVPGKPDESLLIERITSDDDPMPPEDHERLTPEEIEILRQWIETGAEYRIHWSFAGPVKVDPVSDPQDRWSRSPIDRFVFQAMRSHGLQPSAPEDPRRLIRRLALDLTGLPPTFEQVELFANDPSDENYSRIVRELLADPAFGEHWASMWLDLARYADSVGYGGDEPRTIWPWRDWMIRALNENRSLEYVTEKLLAGDLLPQPSESDLLATAMHRNTLSNNEGGTNDEEFRTIAIKDRLRTTAGIWLGLTVNCAECHSHKFDPVSHTEYHQWLAFFDQTEDADRPDEKPVLELPFPEGGGGRAIRVPVLRELPEGSRRTTRIMNKGNFRVTGEAVEPATPEFLHAWPENAPKNRLGLAQWINSPDNPLTVRVFANRYWSRIFGRGLVATEEDFGTQGSLPTHPELLDWLAITFRESGGDMKAMLAMLVSTSTYRQSSSSAAESVAIDPENIWYSRGPHGRLTAEVVRDQALAISGLLDRRMYGPPVYPPNPYTSVTNAFKGAEIWPTSTGPDRYRRSIYTYLKRSQPHPLFDTFDMATREVCCVRRTETNTPLQAFMTLNEEGFFEMAQAFGAWMHSQGRAGEGIRSGFRRSLFRDPEPAELEALQKLWDQVSSDCRKDAEAAKKLVGTQLSEGTDTERADLAAFVVIANVILNMDAVLTR